MDFVLYLSIFLIALLYSSVGHGGATGYLAIMSIWGIKPVVMATTALVLNCLTAGISCFAYARRGYLSLKLSLPFVIVSIPFAFLGARANLSDRQFTYLLGIVLLASAVKLWFYKKGELTEDKFVKSPNILVTALVGGGLGFLAGAIGIGGGVFLSPMIILMGWADPKTTSGCAALFIVCNSIAGLVARQFDGKLSFGEMLPFLLFALVGALVGSIYGSNYSSSLKLMRLISFVLMLAVVKMFL